MSKLTAEQIEKAVNWWADRVCAPKFDGLSDEERRNPSNDAYQMAEMMAMALTTPIADDARGRFIAALREALSDPSFNPFMGLYVDYHPDQTLAAAANKAGIPLTNFPWKTGMGFREDGSVIAHCGYAAPSEEL